MTTASEAHKTVGPADLAELDAVLFPKIKDPDAIAKIIERTQSWTAENLFLTQLIYQYIRQYSAQIIRTEGPDKIVDEVVRQKIVKNWRNNEAANLLCEIEQTLLRFECQDTLMVLYLQILSRGGIAANAQPKLKAEQDILIRSKLVTAEQGQLRLSNRIYAIVFGMDWIEQQLPGLTTRTVLTPTSAELTQLENQEQTVTVPHATETAPTSKLVKSLSTALLTVSGVALLGLTALTNFRAPNNFGAAAQTQTQDKQTTILATATQQNTEKITAQSTGTSVSTTAPKELFDQGLTHATNGRWLPTIQQFCSIPPTSAYFAPAKSQVKRWVMLYPQDIQQAYDTFLTTQNTSCDLLKSALESVT